MSRPGPSCFCMQAVLTTPAWILTSVSSQCTHVCCICLGYTHTVESTVAVLAIHVAALNGGFVKVCPRYLRRRRERLYRKYTLW